jgi:hypothetical protein
VVAPGHPVALKVGTMAALLSRRLASRPLGRAGLVRIAAAASDRGAIRRVTLTLGGLRG